MKPKKSDWYKRIWTLDMQDLSWVEDTRNQVDFLIRELNLTGSERILDLACGFGRHSLELARRGFSVTGVDITPDFVNFAAAQAKKENLPAQFLCADIRELSFDREFDVVLNMADGAIGYLENEEENRKIFERVASALKPGGKHFMDIMNGGYAQTHFPCKLWDAGEKCLTLSNFEWIAETSTLIYGQMSFPYGVPLTKPEMTEGDPIRLYTLEEVREIFSYLGMKVCKTWANFQGKESSDHNIQMMVYSEKTERL